MASTSGIGCEIRKFDDKKITLLKEMMQDVLIIKHHIEAIRHNSKLTMTTTEEWLSLDWCRLSQTQKCAGVPNRWNRRRIHLPTEWKSNHPAPSSART